MNQLVKISFCVIVLFCLMILQSQGKAFGDCPSYCTGFNFETCNNACFDECGTNMQCLYGCGHRCGIIQADCEACQNTTTTSIQSTVVELSSFTATSDSNSIILKWETESEANNAGFNIYRAESENGDYIKINRELISAKGSSTQGAAYEFVDSAVQIQITYYYKLEDFDLLGTFRTHGPIHATAGSTASTAMPGSTTTTTAAAGECAVETIYGERSAEAELLREYRDTVLGRSATGRRIISQYYELSPAVTEFLRKNPAAQERARRVLDSMLPVLKNQLDHISSTILRGNRAEQ